MVGFYAIYHADTLLVGGNFSRLALPELLPSAP